MKLPKWSRCIYCGTKLKAPWIVCRWHRDLLELDPYRQWRDTTVNRPKGEQ